MAHRYRYYVACDPVLSDHIYDVLEREARKILPETSPVQHVGSDLSSSYTKEQITLSKTLK